MLKIGEKKSENPTRLYRIAKLLNPNSYHIETADELKEEWFQNASTVGISAGASTPKWIIESVLKRLEEIAKTLKV